MKNYFFKLIVLAIISTAIVTACQRNKLNNQDKDNDTSIASDHSFAEIVYSDAGKMADEASDLNNGDNLTGFKTESNCATITKDTVANPKTITIDFGPSNCLCNDGRMRRGKIIIDYTGHYKDSGSVHTFHFDNYYVNDNHILGSKTITNMGKNASNQTYFQVVVNGIVVKPNLTDSIVWNVNKTKTWIQGEGTPTRMDDVFQVEGSGNGHNATRSYTFITLQPLIREYACKWFTAGVLEIHPTGKATRTVDFGNGNCDNLATVTINGVSHTITLN